MLKRSWILLLLIPALAVNFSSKAQSSATTNPPAKDTLPLTISVRIDQSTYHLSDNMKMETQVTNVGDDNVYLYDWSLCYNFAAGLVIGVFDSKGKYVQTHFLVDCVPPPPKPGDLYQFIKIEPRWFYGITSDDPIRNMVNEPGEYDIRVSYQSCISAQFVAEFFAKDPISKLPLWTSEKPIIDAPPVHFKVVP